MNDLCLKFCFTRLQYILFVGLQFSKFPKGKFFLRQDLVSSNRRSKAAFQTLSQGHHLAKMIIGLLEEAELAEVCN